MTDAIRALTPLIMMAMSPTTSVIATTWWLHPQGAEWPAQAVIEIIRTLRHKLCQNYHQPQVSILNQL